jgi:hypothetical protein
MKSRDGCPCFPACISLVGSQLVDDGQGLHSSWSESQVLTHSLALSIVVRDEVESHKPSGLLTLIFPSFWLPEAAVSLVWLAAVPPIAVNVGSPADRFVMVSDANSQHVSK